MTACPNPPFETSIAPWLAVADAERALAFYRAAFGAIEEYRLEGESGHVVVARLSVGGARFWIAEDADAAPLAPGVGSVRMIVSVADPDAFFDRAVAAGGDVVAGVHEEHGWRTGRITDPFGHDWEIGRQVLAGGAP